MWKATVGILRTCIVKLLFSYSVIIRILILQQDLFPEIIFGIKLFLFY